MKSDDVRPAEDPEAQLERAFEDEFLRARGYDPVRLAELGPDERSALMKEASAYASAKLAEVQARAHYVHDLHGEH
jgi:hypothetical protein